MSELKITERTIGFELEIADVEKNMVSLPSGYSWSKDETIINTNGKAVKSSSSYGGELNTRPLKLCQSDREELREVIRQVFLHGGKCTWCHGFAVHVYAGDLTLDELRNVFLLCFYTAPYIKKYADVGAWSEHITQAPTPTIDFVERAKEAVTFEQLAQVFSMSLNKRFVRFLVNICSYFTHETIEYRIFNATYDFEKIENSVIFALRFLDFAIRHSEEEFSAICSYDDFINKLKLGRELQKKYEPLIYAGNQESEQDRFISRSISVNSKIIGLLYSKCRGKLAICNPNMFETELRLYDKIPLVIYNNDEFNNIIYLLAREGLRIRYEGKLAFINDYNNETPQRQITCLFLFHRLRKYTSDTEYDLKELEGYRHRIEESIEKIERTSQEIVKMLNTCEYKLGTVEDALENGEKQIFWQYDNNSKARSSVYSLRKNSDYNLEFRVLPVNYYGLLDRLSENQRFFMASYNSMFSMEKVGVAGKQFLYSTEKAENKKVEISLKKFTPISCEIPPDNLQITSPEKIRIVQDRGAMFPQLQQTFIKKVHKIQAPRFAFLVFYEKYCLGGFGFEYPKKAGYDMWLLSDFSTNNRVFRLSKFILLCIKSEKTKVLIRRAVHESVESIYTKVYTQSPVSMKYRGVFKKVHDEDATNYLLYEANIGDTGTLEEVIKTYNKWKQANGK